MAFYIVNQFCMVVLYGRAGRLTSKNGTFRPGQSGGAFRRDSIAGDASPRRGSIAQVRKTPSWPRSWANFSILSLYSHVSAWANLHILGQPNTFLAPGLGRAGRPPRLRGPAATRIGARPPRRAARRPLPVQGPLPTWPVWPASWLVVSLRRDAGARYARKALGWPKICKLAHAFLLEYS